jgi:hypothetical protein
MAEGQAWNDDNNGLRFTATCIQKVKKSRILLTLSGSMLACHREPVIDHYDLTARLTH